MAQEQATFHNRKKILQSSGVWRNLSTEVVNIPEINVVRETFTILKNPAVKVQGSDSGYRGIGFRSRIHTCP